MTIYGYFMWLVIAAAGFGFGWALLDWALGWGVSAPDAEEGR